MVNVGNYTSPMNAIPTNSFTSVATEDTGAAAAAAAEELSPELRQHGSKLLRVAQRLQKIRQEDPKAKAIVFVQWYELEHKVPKLGSYGKWGEKWFDYVGNFGVWGRKNFWYANHFQLFCGQMV